MHFRTPMAVTILETPYYRPTIHYSKARNDFLGLPDVFITSHPRLNDSPLNCITFRSWKVCVAASQPCLNLKLKKTCICRHTQTKYFGGTDKSVAMGEVTI